MMRSRSRSAALFAAAVKRMPGGVSSPVRAFQAVGGLPPFIDRAEGPYLYDVDGNRYIDLVLAYGPHILGHRHPAVVAAITAALERGTAFGATTADEVALAELIQSAFPSIEMVRFVCSGTEATMSAVRLARAATGRRLIVKFEGHYHGHADPFLVAAGSGLATANQPSSPGVPPGTAADTLVLPPGDYAALETVRREHGSELAAIIVEPVAANLGVIPPPAGWLAQLRALADATGAVLIFDEVVTGFRLAFGGAQERFGVRADLTCLGKVIGGGLPVGAYGGARDLMELVAPAGPVYQAGTLAGNPLAIQAGLATLRILQETQPYAVLEQRLTRLLTGWQAAARAAGVPATPTAVGSLGSLFFTAEPVTTVAAARATDQVQFARFHRALLDRGVFLAPSPFEAIFLSTAHEDAVIDQVLAIGEEALQELGR
ncbi:MAG: glutamate-1-semialdehyde 2,1-aminomutase [Dehalococcoidia bacterium]|nr:MAG: glutamate-1-semialdehyde 2,1-aminomutase [Dehalococcoidia bacterium]